MCQYEATSTQVGSAHTGGADTREGRERLLSSLKASAKDSWSAESGWATKPSLRHIEPVAGVLDRVDTRGMVNG
jgi:hypothetical protein